MHRQFPLHRLTLVANAGADMNGNVSTIRPTKSRVQEMAVGVRHAKEQLGLCHVADPRVGGEPQV